MTSNDSTNITTRCSALAASLALSALLFSASAGTARAADWLGDAPLRGPIAVSDWSGAFIGAQAGWVNTDTDFGDSTSSMIAYILRNTIIEDEFHPSSWTTLGHQSHDGTSFGMFGGYNVQWDRAVIGFDVAYNYVSATEASASDSMSRQFATSDGFQNFLTVASQSSMKLKDYATLRLRGGYAMGPFLPYGTLGLAVGRFDYAVTASVYGYGTPPSGSAAQPYCLAGSYPSCVVTTQTDQKNDAIDAGLELGAGVDVALTPNIFLRGEYEFIAFAPVHGIRMTTNTVRAGVAVKF